MAKAVLADRVKTPSLLIVILTSALCSVVTSVAMFFALSRGGGVAAIANTMSVETDADGAATVTIRGSLNLKPSPTAAEARRKRRRRLSLSDDGAQESLIKFSDVAGQERLSVSAGGALRVRDKDGQERVRIGSDDERDPYLLDASEDDDAANAEPNDPFALIMLKDEGGTERVSFDAPRPNVTALLERAAKLGTGAKLRKRLGMRMRDMLGTSRMEAGGEGDGEERRPLLCMKDELGVERVTLDAADEQGWAESGLSIKDRMKRVRVRMASKDEDDVALELKDSSNSTRVDLRAAYGLTLSDDMGR